MSVVRWGPEDLAAPGKRFTGRLVDNLVFLGPFLVGFVAMGAAGPWSGDDVPVLILGVFVLGLALYLLLQHVAFRRTGQSWGKRVAGTRVIALDGSPVGFFRACVLRDLLVLVANATRILGLINGLMVFSASRRCGHDHILGTVVVDVNAVAAHEDYEAVAEVFR